MTPNAADAPARFPTPDARPDVLIIAGEHSGDAHAARLARDLVARGKRVYALGGPALAASGATLLFDMTAFSVVGLFEVLRHLGMFRRLFGATQKWIADYRPRAVCFVDYPGFNLRMAKALCKAGIARKGGGDVGLYYYIGPQIWAWKRRRRFAMAKTLDALAVIFPFETACYADTDLPVCFVGHPFASADFKNPVRYDPEGDILLLPGSRPAAVGRIFPLLLAGFARWRATESKARAVVLYPSALILQKLEAALARFPDLKDAVRLVPSAQKEPVGARAALMSSGTMSLCCCLAGIPGAIVYRAHALTYALGRLVVGIPYLGIGNILLERPAWPEHLQGAAAPEALARALGEALAPERAAQARDDAGRLRALLGEGAAAPSPAEWLLERMAADAAPRA